MRISDWSSDVCSSDLLRARIKAGPQRSLLESYACLWINRLHPRHQLAVREALDLRQNRERIILREFTNLKIEPAVVRNDVEIGPSMYDPGHQCRVGNIEIVIKIGRAHV